MIPLGRGWPEAVFLLTGAIVASCVVGCAERSDAPGAHESAAQGGPETVPRLPRPRPATQAEELAERVRPQDDSWDTEILSEAVGARLEVVRQLLEGSEPITADTVSSLVAEGFAGSSLLPGDLTTSLDGEVFQVRHWQGGSAAGTAELAAANADRQGAPGLAKALEELVQYLGSGDIRVALELIGIEPSEPLFVTRIRLEANRRSSSGGLQVTAFFNAHWQYPAPGAAPRLVKMELDSYEEVTARNRPLFADVTASALAHNEAYLKQVLPGIGAWLGRVSTLSGMSLFGHHGLAVGDVNGDGLEDLYVSEAGGLPNRLYRQNPDGTATDVSARAGLDWLDQTSSALLIDLDNDGDQDLAAATRRYLVLAENDGSGRFRVRRRMPNVVESATSLAAADYDNDGDLDLYVCGYDGDPENSGLPGPYPYHDANNGGRNALLSNEGDFSFVDVTDRVGLDENNTRFSFAAAWEDYDNDGDMDLYVANDFGRNNLYRNDGPSRGNGVFHFEDVAAATGVEDVASGMSVAWGDPDRNGWMDVHVSNMYSSAGNRIAYRRAFSDAAGSATADLQRMARGNSLFSSSGANASRDVGFRDVSEAAGITMGRWAWASRFADLDNDGWQDLVVANGYVSGEDSGDL